MCWVVVTPISVPIQNAYGVSAGLVAFIPMSYMLFYIFINFPSNWVIDVKGIKKGVVIGSSITFLGCLIRCLVRFGFAFVVIGQVFCAIAQPFLLNAPMKIATRWYMPQNVIVQLLQEIVSYGRIISRKYSRYCRWIPYSTSLCVRHRYTWKCKGSFFCITIGIVNNFWYHCRSYNDLF
jgi:MFS family permease